MLWLLLVISMVNFLNLEHFSGMDLDFKCAYQVFDSLIAYQDSNNEDPDLV